MPQLPLTNLAEIANREHAAGHKSQAEAFAHYREAGEALIDAKAQVGHTRWLRWLKKHCPAISDRQAQKYMRFAKSVSGAHLPVGNWRPNGAG